MNLAENVPYLPGASRILPKLSQKVSRRVSPIDQKNESHRNDIRSRTVDRSRVEEISFP